MIHRTFVLGLLIPIVGCYVSSIHRERFASQVPRVDGSVLKVECVSTVKSQVSSIAPSLGNEPKVTLIQDDLTFVVTATAIALNGEPYAEIDEGVKTVLISIDESGFRIEADGQLLVPLEPVADPEEPEPTPTDR